MVVLVEEAWADRFRPVLTVIDGVIVALVWECDGSKHFACFLRLDTQAEATRTHELRQYGQLRGVWNFSAPVLKSGLVRRRCGDHPCA